MELLDEQSLERSPVVANNRMNRERVASGVNSYAKELGFDPIVYLGDRLERNESASWLDLCCGRGRALFGAFHALSHFRNSKLALHGMDLVDTFDAMPANAAGCLRFEVASLHDWRPAVAYDLITCVHGLHYVGDKLGVIARAAGWLKDDGLCAANLDLNNLRNSAVNGFPRQVQRWFRRQGIEFKSRKHLLRVAGRKTIVVPFRFVGAHDATGPNYTGQEAVDSYYVATI